MTHHKNPIVTHQTFVPARVDEVVRDSGHWIFVDIGFAQRRNKSCGVAFHDEDPSKVRFGDLATEVVNWIRCRSGPFHLLIEAPLSVAFDVEGNPTGRKIESRVFEGKPKTRYWYESSGCRTLVAATYFLRELQCRLDAEGFNGQIRLVEGFYSFKTKPTDDAEDVRRLRRIVWKKGEPHDRIVQPSQLMTHRCHVVTSAFAVSGMDFGVPPVVEVRDKPPEG